MAVVAPAELLPPPVRPARLRTETEDAPVLPRRSWPWALCAGAVLGALLTLVLQPRAAKTASTDAAQHVTAAADVRVTPGTERAEADRVAPASAPAEARRSSTVATNVRQPERQQDILPKQRAAHIPQVAPVAAAPVAALPPPDVANSEFGVAPKPIDLSFAPLLPVAPAPAPAPAAAPPPPVTAKSAPVYTGPRQGRLLWTGDLGRHGVIEMEGARVSPGKLSGALPGVPAGLRILPAELSRDGLIVFTSDPQRNDKTEAPGPSNGWNGLRFKFDPVRAHDLVLLETPSAANNYHGFAVRNDGRPYSVVLMEWHVE